MDRMLYVAMSGAQQTMMAQTANNNNLANANTNGFRADLNAFRSMPVQGPGFESRVYAMTERASVDFTLGMVRNTDRDLDIAHLLQNVLSHDQRSRRGFRYDSTRRSTQRSTAGVC